MQDRLLQVQLHIYKCLLSFFQFRCCSEGPDKFVFIPTHHVACVFMYYGHSVGAMHESPYVCRRTHWTVRKLSIYLTVFLKVQDLVMFRTFVLKSSSWLFSCSLCVLYIIASYQCIIFRCVFLAESSVCPSCLQLSQV